MRCAVCLFVIGEANDHSRVGRLAAAGCLVVCVAALRAILIVFAAGVFQAFEHCAGALDPNSEKALTKLSHLRSKTPNAP